MPVCDLCFLVQAQQLLSQYLSLRSSHEAVYLPALFHRQFSDLTLHDINTFSERMHGHRTRDENAAAVAVSQEYIGRLQAGMDYYQRYQRGRLLLLISATFLGSLATNLVIVLRLQSGTSSNRISRTVHRFEAVLSAALTAAWFCQRLPVHFILYYLAPVWTVYRLRTELDRLGPSLLTAARWPASGWKVVVLVIILCETVVAAFFDRRALCLGLILIGATFLR